jgi:hypothetical protein
VGPARAVSRQKQIPPTLWGKPFISLEPVS